MVNYSAVVAELERPNYTQKALKKYQNTNDIIKDLIYCFKNYNYQSEPIVKKFSTGTVKGDSKRIYDFIKNNINYSAEPESLQTTKSFSRCIVDKEGDCKHSALIVGCIGWNLGYNVIFKFVSYTPGESYGHVYTILQNPVTKEKVIVDPLQNFNYEKPYYKKQNYLAINNLKKKQMLSRLTGLESTFPVLSGVEDITETKIVDGIGRREITLNSQLNEEHLGTLEVLSGIGKKTKAQRKESRQKLVKKIQTKVKAVEKKIQTKAKTAVKKIETKHKANVVKRQEKRAARGGSVVKKIALAPVRAAFDGLLLVNFRDLANRLSIAIEKNPVAVQKFAAKFGYKYPFLVSQINKGKNKKPLFGKVSGVGFTVTSAAIVAAAPAVLAVVTLLKGLGIGPKSGNPSDEVTIKESADNIQKGMSSDATPEEREKAITEITRGIENAKKIIESATSTPEQKQAAQDKLDDLQDEKENIANSGSSGFFQSIPKPVLIVGGIGLALFAGKKLKLF